MMSPPPALSEDTGANKKRKHVNDLTSSSTSAQRTVAAAAPCLEEGVEMFDLMDSCVSLSSTICSLLLFFFGLYETYFLLAVTTRNHN
jgi:hypothetical protein